VADSVIEAIGCPLIRLSLEHPQHENDDQNQY
jgi:hypothetical protein